MWFAFVHANPRAWIVRTTDIGQLLMTLRDSVPDFPDTSVHKTDREAPTMKMEPVLLEAKATTEVSPFAIVKLIISFSYKHD